MSAPARNIEPPLSINEAMLYRAMVGIFLAGGFAEVVAACHRQQKRLAKEYRAEVDGQGWIV